jgi:nucleolar protein 6
VSPTTCIPIGETNGKSVGGGGGKSKDRKRKLSDKNERLNEQRKRRNLEEEKQCKEAEEKKFKSEGQMGPRKGKKEGVNNTKGSKPENSVDNGEIHPSRPSRMAV